MESMNSSANVSRKSSSILLSSTLPSPGFPSCSNLKTNKVANLISLKKLILKSLSPKEIVSYKLSCKISENTLAFILLSPAQFSKPQSNKD